MPTFELLLPPQPYSTWRRAHGPTLIDTVARARHLVACWIERARQRQALARLDERMLRDIGITRADAARETEKPFWR